jgi:hypothetical protein
MDSAVNCDLGKIRNLRFAPALYLCFLAITGLVLAAIVTKLMAFLALTYHVFFDCNSNCGPSGIPEGAGGGAAGSASGDPPIGMPSDGGPGGPNLADGQHMAVSPWGPLPITTGGHANYVAVSPTGPLPIVPGIPGHYVAVSPMGPLPVMRTDGSSDYPSHTSPAGAFGQLMQEAGGAK